MLHYQRSRKEIFKTLENVYYLQRIKMEISVAKTPVDNTVISLKS